MQVTIDSKEIESLETRLKNATGKSILFSNGCWLKLDITQPIIWGEDPYGAVWRCSSKKNYIQAIKNWLQFCDTVTT
jgi:hypothetical protein